MKIFEQLKPFIKCGVVVFLFFYSYLVQIIPVLIFQIDVTTASDSTLYALRIFSYLVFSLILFFMYKKELIEKFKEFKKNFWELGDIAFKYWFVGLMVMAISNVLINTFTPAKMVNEEEVQGIIQSVPFLAFLITTIFAPFTEEMTFRRSFRELFFNHRFAYILFSGILFGSLHVVLNPSSLYDLLYIIPYSSLGVAFAALYVKTDNIWCTIFVHMLHNGILSLISILTSAVLMLVIL